MAGSPSRQQPEQKMLFVDALAAFRLGLSLSLTNALKTLIEAKHIYQRITIDVSAQFSEVLANTVEPHRPQLHAQAAQTINARVTLVRAIPAPPGVEPCLAVENVKTFCENCDSREVAAPVWYKDIVFDATASMRNDGRTRETREPHTHQILVLAYQCQRCKGDFSAYTVRRIGWSFSLEGRSPLEHIAIPPFIPKAERNHYRDAVIALHGGKVPAAFFYLRAFVEQFGRRQTGMVGRATGDEILSAYAETLPLAVRGTMPSLRDIYDRLSEAVHNVSEDGALFDKLQEEVDQHFDIRRVHRIPDHKPPAA